MLFGCEGVLVDAIADGGGVAEILVRVVIFEAIQFAQRLPFALRHLNDGIRLAIYPFIRIIRWVAGVEIKKRSCRFALEFLFVVVILLFIHELIVT